jgi:hypothetical protein
MTLAREVLETEDAAGTVQVGFTLNGRKVSVAVDPMRRLCLCC